MALKTYTPPQLAEYGSVSDLTRTVGSFEFRDVYLLASGETVITPNASTSPDGSSFGCNTGRILGGPCLGASR